MTNLTAQLLRVLPSVLFCMTLVGNADPAESAGAVVGWGSNSNSRATPPDAVNGVLGTATDIAASPAGIAHSCAIQAGTGNVICWGDDRHGQATPPDAVNGVLGTATDVSAGWEHSCAIQAGTGEVICWGRGDHGELTPPDAVNGISGAAIKIATGNFHSCAIQAGTGIVVCWGSDPFDRLTPPNAVNGVWGTATEIAAGDGYSCAIQAGTGVVVCWGSNYWGKAKPPAAVNGVSGTATEIAAGIHFSCAIQAGTGVVVCWGVVPAIPDAVNGVSGTATGISVGLMFSCAIQAETGNVICWGNDQAGQATPPDEVNGVLGTATNISAGNWYALAIVAPPEPILLTKAQRACVNAMNKSGEKVNRAQLVENELCLRDFQAERLVAPMTIDDCMTADRRGRVHRAETMTAIWERMTCDWLDSPPPFAYTDSATVNKAAVEGALALTYEIFGGPTVLDANLVTKAEDEEAARCQFAMLKRADQLENTVFEEINKAKKRALRDETVDGAAALEAELLAVFSSNDRITRIQDRLVRWVDRNCADLQIALDTVFPGECAEGGPNLREVEDCVIAVARCEACVKINAFDDLNLDCDQADDQDVNGSCPLASNDGINSGLPTNADCFPPRLPDSAPRKAIICIALANSAPDMLFTPADYERLPEDCKSIVLPECR